MTTLCSLARGERLEVRGARAVLFHRNFLDDGAVPVQSRHETGLGGVRTDLFIEKGDTIFTKRSKFTTKGPFELNHDV